MKPKKVIKSSFHLQASKPTKKYNKRLKTDKENNQFQQNDIIFLLLAFADSKRDN